MSYLFLFKLFFHGFSRVGKNSENIQTLPMETERTQFRNFLSQNYPELNSIEQVRNYCKLYNHFFNQYHSQIRRFPPKETKKAEWDTLMKFWQEFLINYAISCGKISFTLEGLNDVIKFPTTEGAYSPLGLETVLVREI
jgi:hypothetical protein